MRTFLYNTNTGKREGEIREGRYLVDGQPGVLPDYLIELEIEKRSDPPYDSATQTIEYRAYADLPNFKWIEESYVRNLTPTEIAQRQPKLPDTCTPRQLRIALIQNGISPSLIDSQINAITDSVEREIAYAEWEYALEIKKDHPLVEMMAINLNLTKQQVDNIFILAVTL
jgi:hypothetical protein